MTHWVLIGWLCTCFIQCFLSDTFLMLYFSDQVLLGVAMGAILGMSST